MKQMKVQTAYNNIYEEYGQEMANAFFEELKKWDQTMSNSSLMLSFYDRDVLQRMLNYAKDKKS